MLVRVALALGGISGMMRESSPDVCMGGGNRATPFGRSAGRRAALSAVSRLFWPAHTGRIRRGRAGSPVPPSRPVQPPRAPPGRAGRPCTLPRPKRTSSLAAGPLDDQLSARLLHQRIVVLGAEVDDPIANRICAQLLLLSAEDQRTRHQPLHQLPGRLGLRGPGHLRHDAADPQRRQHAGHGPGREHGPVPAVAPARPASGSPCRTPGSSCTRARPGSAAPPSTSQIQAENLEHTETTDGRLIAEHTGQPVRADRAGLRCGTAGSPRRRRGLRVRRPTSWRRVDDVRPAVAGRLRRASA